MKQIRLIIFLAVTAVLALAAFLIINSAVEKREKQQELAGPKTLFYFDGNEARHLEIDNEDGHFAFDWNEDAHLWELVSGEQFDVNSYAISAIVTYFCELSSLKTVAPDCQDTSPYGFDNPVTLKLSTTQTGEDHPYVLYVGSCTPTFDAYYVMTDASDDVYTIDYTAGSCFCVAKNTMKNMYIFDVGGYDINYIRFEADGETTIETNREDNGVWHITKPVKRDAFRANVENLTEVISRAEVTKYIEENVTDLEKYGLDKPKAKVWLKSKGADRKEREIWFGGDVPGDDTLIYGLFVESKEVFTITKGEASFATADPLEYFDPYCLDVLIEDLNSIEVDLGDVADVKTTLHLDYENTQYSLDDTDITAMEDEEILSMFTGLYRAVTLLKISGLDPDEAPAGDPAMKITYHFKDGSTQRVEFVEKEPKVYGVFLNGKYEHVTIRLNRFTESTCLIPAYETLQNALKNKK